MAAIDNERFSDQMRFNESMARHTSWRTGGNADTWFRPATREDLIAFMQTVEPGTPLHWVGLGSNLLVRDGGIRGVVIVVQDALAAVEDIDKQRVSAGSGVACTVFARHCVRRGLGPAEFFAGIPGTIGGALAMNAGAFGGETWNQVESVDVIDQEGKVHTREPAEYTIAYRQVDGPANEWFLGAHFVFTEDYDTSMDKVKVSRAVASLLKHGFIESHIDPADQRCNLIRLTREGRRVMAHLIPMVKQLEQDMLNGISNEEYQLLLDVMRRVRHNAKVYMGR